MHVYARRTDCTRMAGTAADAREGHLGGLHSGSLRGGESTYPGGSLRCYDGLEGARSL